MKFLFDMNLSPSWVEALAGRGMAAAHWSGLGSADAPDAAIADYARAHDFIVVTNDLDFGTLLAADRTQLPSVIQLRMGDLRPTAMLDIFCRAVELTAPDLETGALVTIGGSRLRVTPLPINPDFKAQP